MSALSSKAFAVLALAAAPLLVSGCAAPVLGVAGAAGYVGLQARPSSQVAQDTKLKLSIKDSLRLANFSYLTDVGIDVYYGDVLVTGVVPTQADGEKVLDLARRTVGVRKVYNELFVGAAYGASQKTKDAWIAAQVQSRLLGNKYTYPLNYLITVVNTHAYIMGEAATAEESRHALHVLRTTQGVAQVHDYLVIKNTRQPNTGPEEGLTATELPGSVTPSRNTSTQPSNPNPLPEN